MKDIRRPIKQILLLHFPVLARGCSFGLAQASACAVIDKRDYFYSMSRKYKFHDQDKLYFISFATVHWIDVFIREDYMQIITDCWKFCQEKKGLEIYG